MTLLIQQWILQKFTTPMVALQVGANDHSDNDIVKTCINNGWSAHLYEPNLFAFTKLANRYNVNKKVSLFNRPMCTTNIDNMTFYHVDVTNATGNFGSSHADARCMRNMYGSKSDMWITQLSSLSLKHIMKHNFLFRKTPKECLRCAKFLNSPKMEDCMRDVITHNLRSTSMQCAHTQLERADLIVVDVEGFDDLVLYNLPLERLRPQRIVFEGNHLKPSRIEALSRFLSNRNYTCLNNKRSPQSDWALKLESSQSL